MDPITLAATVLAVGIVLLILMGAPISVAIGLPSVAATAIVLGTEGAVLTSAQRLFTGINSFPLLAIPFFVLAGGLMNHGGIATRLVDAAKVLVGRMPGALAQTNVVGNAMFGSVSGAAVAAAAAVGGVMVPRQADEGYDRSFAAAVNVASAPAGMMIPPSNTFIVYSLVSSTSIAALFMAGYGPGILWALACMTVVYLYARKRPELRSTVRVTFRGALVILGRAVPSMLMILIVVGGILAGVFTPTESAAIAVLYCLVLCAVYRTVTIAALPGILLDASRTTAIVMLLIGVSSAMSWVMSFAGIPRMISDLLLSVSENPTVILLVMMAFLLVLGTFMDPTPAILIFVPIFLPIATSLGIDPIHFGAVVVFNLSIGTITPPVGNVLFIGARVASLPIESVTRRLIPFFASLVAVLLLVAFVPEISIWLPTTLGLMESP